MIRCACSFAIVACYSYPALADVAPARPYPGCLLSKHVIKLDQEIPGYRFFLFHGTDAGGETIDRELKLSTEKALVIPDTDTPPLVRGVIAVPDKVMDELKNNDNLAKLCARNSMDKRPPGVVVRWYRGFFGDLRKGDPRTTIIMLSTVSPNEEKGVKFSTRETSEPLTLEELPETSQPSATRKADPTEPAPQPRSATVMAGIAIAVAVAAGGLWWFRRK
jgi:hypothetical protein